MQSNIKLLIGKEINIEVDDANSRWKKEQNRNISKIESSSMNWQKRCREIVKEYQKILSDSKSEVCERDIQVERNVCGDEGIQVQQKKKRDRRVKVPHSAMWQYNFKKLLRFRDKFNHCHVPIAYSSDPTLARWVKRQRYHYKLFIRGKSSPMKRERIEMLEKIGFIWDGQVALWQERLNELLSFKKSYGHCSVPTIFPGNQALATWVKFQRRQYKLFSAGQPTYLTAERIAVLEKHGFQWKTLGYKP
mmetsp:Transcript_17853/g.26410  ORF Transcript_17853/g.26410 Transcript_17853/m.26410 type:complete len:248 (+) Transcript_17853:102-845(+)|eukprot:CAMPEP_0194236960 /NCGR_PEP_ID=MMETSP0158-20130606/4107_1 /TAXON_ID=33649 /ORGANISM="Thalassionema nitzschioides, Strain L26-B" /LENGTH=247 /DNA_ID=CAMNT_0038970867 /DNA_START=75 /DNA_END=818 /DNA_ORIENTATION=-